MHDLMRVDGARNSWQTSVAVHTHERLMLQDCSYLYVAALLYCSIAPHLSRGQNLSLASLPLHACMHAASGRGCGRVGLRFFSSCVDGSTPPWQLCDTRFESLDTDECGVLT